MLISQTLGQFRYEGRKFVFNNALNTFYLWLYGIGYIMVKDHSDNQRGNLLVPLHGIFFLINSIWFYLYAPSHRQNTIYHGLCYTSPGALVGTSNSSMGPP